MSNKYLHVFKFKTMKGECAFQCVQSHEEHLSRPYEAHLGSLQESWADVEKLVVDGGLNLVDHTGEYYTGGPKTLYLHVMNHSIMGTLFMCVVSMDKDLPASRYQGILAKSFKEVDRMVERGGYTLVDHTKRKEAKFQPRFTREEFDEVRSPLEDTPESNIFQRMIERRRVKQREADVGFSNVVPIMPSVHVISDERNMSMDGGFMKRHVLHQQPRFKGTPGQWDVEEGFSDGHVAISAPLHGAFAQVLYRMDEEPTPFETEHYIAKGVELCNNVRAIACAAEMAEMMLEIRDKGFTTDQFDRIDVICKKLEGLDFSKAIK